MFTLSQHRAFYWMCRQRGICVKCHIARVTRFARCPGCRRKDTRRANARYRRRTA